MIKYSNKNNSTVFFAVLAFFFTLVISFSYVQKAEAGSCGGLGAATFGNCAVNEDPDTNWQNPSVKIKYEGNLGVVKGNAKLKHGDCDWLGGMFRFCARIAAPLEYGNTDPDKPKLCVYEDSMDGGDTDASFMPFHQGTPRDNALNTVEIIAVSAAAGSIIPGIGTTFGAAVGLMVALIMQDYNHVVIRNVGCVKIPIAVGPPIFCHRCWFNNSIPEPEILNSSDSSFLSPVVQVLTCKDANDKASKCYKKLDGTFADGIVISEQISLSPSSGNGFKNKQVADDGREFEARIDLDRTSKICVYLTKTPTGETMNELQGCIDRSGFMPQPTLTNTGSINSNPRINITLAGVTKSLFYQDSNLNCDTLHQSEFCAYQYCLDRNVNDGSCTVVDDKVCIEGYKPPPLVVVNKSDDKPVVGLPNTEKNGEFINLSSLPEIDSNGKFIYNKVNFGNDVNIYEAPHCFQRDADNNCTNYCNIERDADGAIIYTAGKFACTNTGGGVCATSDDSGTCVSYENNVTNDNYTVNYDTQTIRPLRAEEMAMCVDIPEPATDITTVKVYSSPGTYQYNPPARCTKIEITMWGAGSSGSNSEPDGQSYIGGGGAYLKATMDVNPDNNNKTYEIIVGRGGEPTARKSGSSTQKQETHYGDNGGYSQMKGEGSQYARANGGIKNAGGYSRPECKNGAVCTATASGMIGAKIKGVIRKGNATHNGSNFVYGDTKMCDGNAHYDSNLHIKSGSAYNNYYTGNLKFPATGLGGCSVDRSGNYGTDKYWGHVGTGGHGKVKVRCMYPDGTLNAP